jgi:hypothetical protein
MSAPSVTCCTLFVLCPVGSESSAGQQGWQCTVRLPPAVCSGLDLAVSMARHAVCALRRTARRIVPQSCANISCSSSCACGVCLVDGVFDMWFVWCTVSILGTRSCFPCCIAVDHTPCATRLAMVVQGFTPHSQVGWCFCHSDLRVALRVADPAGRPGVHRLARMCVGECR